MKRIVLFIYSICACTLLSAHPDVPDYVVFARDTIRFDRSDLRERMDRELITFSYMHTSSILMIKRANRLFPQIEPILKENNIPDDMKYVMVIESSLDPKAVSPAGAAGLWQLMKETAKGYGLVVDSEVDERYNTEKATKAACRYFKEAYNQFRDWPTVAASYNAGKSGISKRLSDQRKKSALDLWMAEETTRYIFRVIAAKLYFENPAAFGFSFKREDLYPYIPPIKTVEVSGAITSLVDFAEQYGVSYMELKNANLWLRDSKLINKEHRTYHIDIPDVKASFYSPSRTKVHSQRWLEKDMTKLKLF